MKKSLVILFVIFLFISACSVDESEGTDGPLLAPSLEETAKAKEDSLAGSILEGLGIGTDETSTTTTETKDECVDSDDGYDLYLLGTLEGTGTDGNKVVFADSCSESDDSIIYEGFCNEEGYAEIAEDDCGFGYTCEDGACIGDTYLFVDGSESTFAINLETGGEMWTKEGNFHSATSVSVEEGVLYTEIDGKILALDAADGTELWSSTEIGKVGTTLSVSNGVVYVGNGYTGTGQDGNFYAINGEDGSIAWTYTNDFVADYTMKPHVEDNVVYTAYSDGSSAGSYIIALNVADGSIIWEANVAIPDSSEVLFTDDGKIFTGGSKHIEIVDQSTGEIVSKIESVIGDNWWNDVEMSGNMLYFNDASSPYVKSFELSSQTTIWEKEFDENIAELVLDEETETLYALSERATVYALKKVSGEELWVSEPSDTGELGTDIIVYEEFILARDTTHVRALDKDDGTELWVWESSGSPLQLISEEMAIYQFE